MLIIYLLIFILGLFLFININPNQNNIIKPKLYGVNLSGIYLLEDWFYSYDTDTFDVATSKDKPEGVITMIFPDLKKIISDKSKFYGECDLINKLLDYNLNYSEIYNLFQKHRKNYILDLPNNFKLIKNYGIESIRLPLTWCIKYDNEYIIDGLNDNWVNINQDSLIVEDPYFNNDMYWCAINIKDIEKLLDLAYDYNLKILIDIHTFPGGQSDGSYSGQWPKKPRFWNNTNMAKKNMRTIMKNLYDWITNLNSKRYSVIEGISPMNEPAHLRNTENRINGWNVSDNDILEILEESVKLYKEYPQLINDKKLVMNVIETSIYPGNNWGYVYGNWWRNITTKQDRLKWAVIDVHHYAAWDDPKFCNNDSICNYNIKNYSIYSKIRSELGLDLDDLLYSSEFSASTEQSTNLSLTSGLLKNKNYKELRDKFLNSQLIDMEKNNVKGFFWCWSIPYNSNYQNEWSLKNIII